jgi:hypothetical protein
MGTPRSPSRSWSVPVIVQPRSWKPAKSSKLPTRSPVRWSSAPLTRSWVGRRPPCPARRPGWPPPADAALPGHLDHTDRAREQFKVAAHQVATRPAARRQPRSDHPGIGLHHGQGPVEKLRPNQVLVRADDGTMHGGNSRAAPDLVKSGDVAVTDQRLGIPLQRPPVDTSNQPQATAPATRCDHCADARITQSPVEVGEPVVIIPRHVAVSIQDVGAHLGLQPPGLQRAQQRVDRLGGLGPTTRRHHRDPISWQHSGRKQWHRVGRSRRYRLVTTPQP